MTKRIITALKLHRFPPMGKPRNAAEEIANARWEQKLEDIRNLEGQS